MDKHRQPIARGKKGSNDFWRMERYAHRLLYRRDLVERMGSHPACRRHPLATSTRPAKGETMNILRGDLNCQHCLGVGEFGGALFGGRQICYCRRPQTYKSCNGEGINRNTRHICLRCEGSGKDPTNYRFIDLDNPVQR